MSEDRDKLLKTGEELDTENDDVEAHKLQANDEPETSDEDVEAHKLQ